MRNLKIDIQKKYVFIILSILLFLGVIYRFFPDFQELVSPEQEVLLKDSTLIKYRKIVSAGKGLDKRLASLDSSLKQLETRLLSGKTTSLAAVEIQQIFNGLAGKSNVQVTRVKVLKPEELDQKDYLRIPVEFYILPTIRQLKEVLYRIENSQKFLRVIKINTKFFVDKAMRLRCRITIAGFMKRAEN